MFKYLVGAAAARTWKQDSELIAGVFWGVMEKEMWTELELCFKDAETFSTQVLEAYHLMAQETPIAMIKGAEMLAEAM